MLGHACLFRWFWDTGASPDAVLKVTGTQTNLRNDEPKCGTDSVCDVQNAAAAWHGVTDADVHASGPVDTGNINVVLDATMSQDNGSAWNTPLDCPGGVNTGGVIGLGGPGSGWARATTGATPPTTPPTTGPFRCARSRAASATPRRRFARRCSTRSGT